jgi:hypothetical protein
MQKLVHEEDLLAKNVLAIGLVDKGTSWQNDWWSKGLVIKGLVDKTSDL